MGSKGVSHMASGIGKGVSHMAAGVGKDSYATNSRLQEKAIRETSTIIEKAIREVYMMLRPSRMVMADLGCSSGPNTLLVVTKAIHTIASQCHKLQSEMPEIQFFLNDLPGNDFNSIFRSLDKYEHNLDIEIAEEYGITTLPPHYIAAIPGSFYGRLFPISSVHFFHSSFSLMWLSQVPRELENGINDPSLAYKDDIYIWKTSPPHIVEAYQRQYSTDFSAFLRARHAELISGGRMVLTFLGRSKHHPVSGEVSQLWKYLADAMSDMILEGILPKEKLESLNMPFYIPSMEEVEEIIFQLGEGLFYLEQSQIIELNWDPFDDEEDNDFGVFDSARGGTNAVTCVRAVIQPFLKHHFGIEEDDNDSIFDDLFLRYAKKVAHHLLREKTKYPVFVIVLKALS